MTDKQKEILEKIVSKTPSKWIEESNKRLYSKYNKTKVKEFLKGKRKFITLNSKRETTTITGVPINKNGKPIFNLSNEAGI